jgi:hypothetical protein
MAPRKKSNTGLIVGLIIGGVVLCCIVPLLAGGGLAFWGWNKTKGLIQCTYAFSDVRDALRMYASEHEGKLPPADTWQEEITPYYEKVVASNRKEEHKMFGIMPSGGDWGCDNGSGGRTGISLNEDLAGMPLTKLENSEEVVLFEVKSAARNAHGKYEPQPIAGSPSLFGEARGWFLIRLSGPPMLLTKRGEKPVDAD